MHAIDHQGPVPQFRLNFAWVNYWLIHILLYLALLRGIFTFYAVRIQAPFLNALIGQNLKDTQFRPRGFLVGAIITVAVTGGISLHYSNVPTAALLAFSYANALLLAAVSLFPGFFEYSSN